MVPSPPSSSSWPKATSGTSFTILRDAHRVSRDTASGPTSANPRPSADLRINTVHAVDIAQALYLTGLWLAATPRDQALKEAGVPLPFPFNPPPASAFSLNSHKRTSSFTDTWKTVKTVVPESEAVTAPLFNVTDDEDSTQGSLAKAVAAVWGVNFGFLSSTVATLVQQFAKVRGGYRVSGRARADLRRPTLMRWSRMSMRR